MDGLARIFITLVDELDILVVWLTTRLPSLLFMAVEC